MKRIARSALDKQCKFCKGAGVIVALDQSGSKEKVKMPCKHCKGAGKGLVKK